MAPRRLLLVGEGNFSFAAAVSETLDPSTSLTATCLQRPADLAGDPAARENLRRLRERGSEAPPSAAPPSGGAAGSENGVNVGVPERIAPAGPVEIYRKPALCLDQGCFARFRLGQGFLCFQVLRHPPVYISWQVQRYVLVWTAPSWQMPLNCTTGSLTEFVLTFRTVDAKLE